MIKILLGNPSLQRGKTTSNKFPVYDTKRQFRRMWSNPLSASLPGSLWVEVPVRISSLSQVKLFNYLRRIFIICHLKSWNRVEILCIW